MKKLFCFLTAICFAFLMSVTASAEDFDVELSVRDSTSKSVCIDVFLDAQTPVFGGEFTLSFDEDFVVYSDVDSEYFDAEAFVEKDKVKLIIANEECVVFDDKPAFSVKLSRMSKDGFAFELTTEYLVNDMFEKIELENDSVKITVDSKAVLVSDDSKEDKTVKGTQKDKSKITEIENDDTDKSNVLPIKIQGKSMELSLLLAVGVLVIVAFLFGLVFRKYMASMQEDNNDTIKIEK